MDSFEYVYESVFENLICNSERLENYIRDGHTALFICPDIWKMANDYSFRYDYGDEPKSGQWKQLQTTGLIVLTKDGVLDSDSVLDLVTDGSKSRYKTVSSSVVQNSTADTFDIASIAANRLNVSTNVLFTNFCGESSSITMLDKTCNCIMRPNGDGFVFHYAYLNRDGSGMKTMTIRDENRVPALGSIKAGKHETEVHTRDFTICRIMFKDPKSSDGSSLACSFTK